MFEGTFSRGVFWRLKRRLSVLDAGEEVSLLSELPVSMLHDFHLQVVSATANRSMTGQPGLDCISLLLPKLYCSDKRCQYIDWMSESWKTAFSYTTKPCHIQSTYSTFNSTALPTSPHPLANFSYWGRKHPFSRLGASINRKRKVNWALRQDD